MPYEFPERYPRTNDTIDIDTLNKQFSTIVENITGTVGEHNLAEAAYTIADSARYKIHYASTLSQIGFGGPSGSPAKHARPQEKVSEYSGSYKELPNSGSWERIQQVSIPSSDSFRVLHIFSHTNYNWTGYTSGSNADSNINSGTSSSPGSPVAGRHEFSNSNNWGFYSGNLDDENQPYEAPGFQVALRVLGTRYGLSGQRNETRKPHMPLRSEPENQTLDATFSGQFNDDKWPGTLNYRTKVVSGPAHTTMTVDLVDIVSLPPGPATTVEVIAKRTQPLKAKKYNSDDVVVFLNRNLFVVSYFTSKAKTRSISAVGVSPIRKGDAATTTQLNTNILQKIKTKIDALTASDFVRLNRYHMAKPLVETNTGNLLIAGRNAVEYSGGTGTLDIKNRLPGETTSTFASVGTLTGVNGWTPLVTAIGGSTEFLASVPGSSGAPNANTKGYILLTGHIHIQKIAKSNAGNTALTNQEYQMGCVALYYKTASSRVLINNSVVPLSRVTLPLPLTAKDRLAVQNNSDNIHVPLMAVIDTKTAYVVPSITDFGICVSTINWENADDITVEVKNASLNFEYYKSE